MIHCVEVAQHTDCAADRPGEQVFPMRGTGGAEALALPEEKAKSDDQCHQIPKEAFLKGGDIPCHADADIHTGKAKGGGENEQDALMPGIQFREDHRLSVRLFPAMEYRANMISVSQAGKKEKAF